LNWANQEVRDAVKDVMRFWLALGVDGFRADAVYWIGKDPLFRDDDVNPSYVDGEDRRYNGLAHNNSRGWPSLYAHLSELVAVLKEPAYAHRQPFMVTEVYPRRENLMAGYMQFYESIDPTYSAPFNFEGVLMGWDAGVWRRFLRAFHLALDELSPQAVASYAFGNHDFPRIATRYGATAARSAALMQLTLPGMAFVYYGEEIGMHNVPIPPIFIRDPQARDNPHYSRDPARTPMQWDDSPNAGFSTAHGTWLPLADDYKEQNVKLQRGDDSSFFTLYRTLIHLRKRSAALREGRLQVLELGHPDLLGYVRSSGKEHYVVLLNFSDKPVHCVPGVVLRKLVLSSNPETKLTDSVDSEVELLPYEGALFMQ
jgi:alpha-glucosidase